MREWLKLFEDFDRGRLDYYVQEIYGRGDTMSERTYFNLAAFHDLEDAKAYANTKTFNPNVIDVQVLDAATGEIAFTKHVGTRPDSRLS